MLNELRSLIDNSFINYKGVIIEKVKDGFIVLKTWRPSLEETKQLIDQSFNTLKQTIYGFKK